MKKNIKKALAIILMAVFLTVFVSACKTTLASGSTSYSHVHICDLAGNIAHATLKDELRDNEYGIMLETEEYGHIFLCRGSFILYNDMCPICCCQ